MRPPLHNKSTWQTSQWTWNAIAYTTPAYHAGVIYLGDLVHFANNDSQQNRLQSATTRAATPVRTRTKLGDCAFPPARPLVWNSLPPSLRHTQNSVDISKHICSNRQMIVNSLSLCYVLSFLQLLHVYWHITNLHMIWYDALRSKNRIDSNLLKLRYNIIN